MVVAREDAADLVLGEVGEGLGNERLKLLPGQGVSQLERRMVYEVVDNLGAGRALAPELPVLVILAMVVVL